MSSNLNWTSHIRNIRCKAMRNLGYIKRLLGQSAPVEAKRLLYMTHVRSVLQYGSQLWSPYKKSEIMYLESVQRQATKFMVNYEIGVSYVERLQRTNLLPLSYLREIHDLVLFYNLYNQRLNVNLDRYFLIHIGHRRGRRGQNKGILPRLYKTEKSKSFYTSRVLAVWSSLPDNIKNTVPPLNATAKPLAFKRQLYKLYFSNLVRFDVGNVCTWVSVCQCSNCRS